MKLLFFRDEKHTNFGDELNRLIFPPLFPGLFNKGEELFYGIGTLLNKLNPKPTVVFGSGAGYYPIPDLSGVDVRFVRGPRSAEVLGIQNKWITDPGILIAQMPIVKRPLEYGIVFMPRWTTLLKDDTLEERLKEIGVSLVSPLNPPERVLSELAGANLVISEALHGVIAADALRIPWIAAYGEDGHTFKWLDWCASMEIIWNPVDLRVSSMKWAADHATRMLTRQEVFNDRLQAIQSEVALFKSEYCTI